MVVYQIMPKSVASHYYTGYLQHYHNSIRTKWPCPKGYRELVYGDVGTIYTRNNLARNIIATGWDTFNYGIALDENGARYITDPTWYLIKE